MKITLINYLIDPCRRCQDTTRYPNLLLIMALHELSNWLNFSIHKNWSTLFGGFGPLVKHGGGLNCERKNTRMTLQLILSVPHEQPNWVNLI
jgi:hypothetical protein